MKHLIPHKCLLATVLSIIASFGIPGTSPAAEQDVSYGPAKENTLDICRAQDGPGRKPGVILIHGGGWNSRDKSDMQGWCKRAADAGLVAVTVNYRLADASKRDTWWPAQLADLQLAVRWMRAHSEPLGLDPTRICSLGTSAGGHLAVFLGAAVPVAHDPNATLLPGYASDVSCVVDNFGPVDMTDPAFGHDAYKALFGGATLSEKPDAYAEASPLPLISSHSAPMLIAHGYQDAIVPFSQSVRLAQSLASHGIPADFIGFTGGHREFGNSAAQTERITDAEIHYLLAH